jgi:hypothetical protein
MPAYGGKCRIFIYLQAGQPARLRLIKPREGGEAGRPAFGSGRCSETAELEGTEPIINTPPHLSRHPMGIREKQRFWLEESRKSVRRCDTTRP